MFVPALSRTGFSLSGLDVAQVDCRQAEACPTKNLSLLPDAHGVERPVHENKRHDKKRER